MARADDLLPDSAQDRALRASVQPPGWSNPHPLDPYPLLVVGGGAAGLSAARAAAARGVRVALVERHRLGGLHLNYGDVPMQCLIRSARLYAEMRDAAVYGVRAPHDVEPDFGLAMQRMRRIREQVGRLTSAARVAAHGIDLYFGTVRFVDADALDIDGVRVRFDKAIIATGSRCLLPTIPGLAEAGYLTSETIFDMATLPRSMLVIGGGPVGCQFAQTFCRLGVRTIIAQSEPLFLPNEERDAAQLLTASLARDGVEIHLNSAAVNVRVEQGQKIVETVNDGNVTHIAVEQIVTGIGRAPAVAGLDLEAAGVAFDPAHGIEVDDFLCTTNRRIHAAGDVCLKRKFTDTARASARIAVGNALGFGHERLSALTIPWCTYTDPEIAHVGLYVHEAREQGIPVKTYTVPMHQVDRAVADGEAQGFAKIHVRDGSDTILGATVVARHAGDMINDLSLAMVAGIGLETVARVIHAYPTQAEAIKMAAGACSEQQRSRLARWLMRR